MEKLSSKSGELKEAKNSVRRLIRDRISTLPDDYLTTQSQKIYTQVAEILKRNQARHVALFAARKGEVNLLPLLSLLPTASFYFPRVCGPREMEFHKISNVSEFIIGKWGIREPHPSAPTITPQNLDHIILPGAAFSISGDRLGYGGGFYDTLLPKSRATKLGVCFPCQILPEIPTEAHDCRVQFILTGDQF